MTTDRMDMWRGPRRERKLAADRHLYAWIPADESIRHATNILGMDRDAAVDAAFRSIRQRDPAKWGGPGA